MKILILCALNQELKILNSNFENIKTIGEYPYKFFQTNYKDIDIITAKCGLGKIRSAGFTQYCIDNLNFDLLINFGSCGQVDENVSPGDIVFCEKIIEYDFYTLRDFVPEFSVHHNIPDNIFKDFQIKKGILLTATQNVDSVEKKIFLKKKYNGTVADWEGAAVAQICSLNKKRFFIFKVITDRGDENLLEDYKKFFDKIINEKSKKFLDFLSFLNLQGYL